LARAFRIAPGGCSILENNRAVVPLRITHVGPVDVPGGDIECEAIGQFPAFAADGRQIGAVRVCGKYATGAEVQEKSLPNVGAFFAPVSIDVEAFALM
jgi:hypothetical protein